MRNDVVDKTKKIEDLKALQGQKGDDIAKTRNKLNKINSIWQDVSKINVLSKLNTTGMTLIIPRNDLIKTPAMKMASGSETIIGKLAELMKKYPDMKAQIKVYGFGKPDKTENTKATENMAGILKTALVKAGGAAANISASGAGTTAPLYSKSAVEDNRRVEITFSDIISQ